MCGGALVAAAVALSLITLRSLTGERAQATAAMSVAAATQDAERGASELRAIEAKAQAAADLRPLSAAIAAQVDSATLLDLLDNEDWWRPYREEFAVVRVIVGDQVIAARGGPAAGDEAAVVALARKQLVGSARATRDGRSFLLAAARLSVLPEKQPVLVLGLHAPAPASPTLQPQDGRGTHPLSWALAAAVGLGGVGLLVTGRKQGRSTAGRTGQATGAVTIELPREPTLRIGSRREVPQPPAPLPDVAPPARAGKPFGRYRLLDRLGEGGMAEIFLAEASGVAGFTRTFVLKRLRPELARDKDAVAQFVDEARLQAGLVHSNIVPVFDFGVVDGEYFMTQEYIVGRDLARLVERHPGRPARAAGIFRRARDAAGAGLRARAP